MPRTHRKKKSIKKDKSKYCPVCKRVCEVTSLGGNSKKLMYNDIIRPCGHDKVICPNCKKNKPAKEVYVDPIKPGFHDPRKRTLNHDTIYSYGQPGYGN